MAIRSRKLIASNCSLKPKHLQDLQGMHSLLFISDIIRLNFIEKKYITSNINAVFLLY